MKFLLSFCLMALPLTLDAQDLRIGASIYQSPSPDFCKYWVVGFTKVFGTERMIAVQVDLEWTLALRGSFPPSISRQTDTKVATGTGDVVAEIRRKLNLPIGDFDAELIADHYGDGAFAGHSVTSAFLTCQPVSSDPCDDCGTGGGNTGCEEYDFFCKWGGGNQSLTNCPPDCASPILIDLAGDGFQLGGYEGATLFDLLGTNWPFFMHWVAPSGNDAFLVADHNDNGLADDGRELFGNGTVLLMDQRRAPNGFVGLAQWDRPELGGDDDGFITASDKIWDRLMLWTDLDADGVAQEDEMGYLDEFGLTRLETIPRRDNYRDEHGNRLAFRALSYSESGHPLEMVDVFFKRIWPR